MVTDEGTRWPLWVFWAGFGAAVASLLLYVRKARTELAV